MNYYVVATVAIALIAIISALLAVASWVFHRGQAEGNFDKSMRDNTAATQRLTDTVDTLQSSLHLGFREVHDRVDKHDVVLAEQRTTIAAHDRDLQRLQARVG
jgi:hypothetical protein